MCGRYVAYSGEEYTEMENIVREVEKKLPGGALLKLGEVFPTDLAPVLIPGHYGIQAVPMVWGFPRWNGGGVVINARAETAAEKKMFRSALFNRRLVVPSTGFFEWQRIDGKKLKDKYMIRLPREPMLYMAGLYNLYKEPNGSETGRFVILTTGANGYMSELHDRMPVILGAEDMKSWLSDGDKVGQILSRPGPELILEKVS
ncbi:putative SOS response-associated peptidase YedK [bioreactor metagenome]|uniref:Putative SOS response-associated peptidase YedK n=1 Tax=bioreactor metagenome TaxID=1076179 RepID=A0A644XAZ0_9ZZZZ